MARKPRKPRSNPPDDDPSSSDPNIESGKSAESDARAFDDLLNEDPDLEPPAGGGAGLPTDPEPTTEPFAPAGADPSTAVKIRRVIRREVKERIIKTCIAFFPSEADGLISRGMIIKTICSQYGVSRASVEKFFLLARQRVREQIRTDTIESREDHTWLAHQTYRTIIRDGLACMRSQMGEENEERPERYSGMVDAKTLLVAQAADIQLLGLARQPLVTASERDSGSVTQPLIQIRQAMMSDPKLRDLAAEMSERMAGLDLVKRAPQPVNGQQAEGLPEAQSYNGANGTHKNSDS